MFTLNLRFSKKFKLTTPRKFPEINLEYLELASNLEVLQVNPELS